MALERFNQKWVGALLTALFILFALAYTSPVQAGDDCSFLPADGDWLAPASWSCGHVPTGEDAAYVDSGHTARLASNTTVGSLTLGGMLCGNMDGSLIGNLTIASALYWSQGTMDGNAQTIIAPGATAYITDAKDHWLTHSRHLVNQGTIVWTAGSIIGNYNDPKITNQAGAVFDAQGDNGISLNSGTSFIFDNFGTLQKSGGAGSTTFKSMTINNHGAINAQAGVISLPYYANTDIALNLYDGSSFSGAGVTRVGFGTLTHMGGTVTSQNLELNNLAYLQGTGSIQGTLSWTGGYMDGAGTLTIPAGSTLNVSGTAEKRISHGYTLANYGTVIWSAGSIVGYYNTPVINNMAGGLFEATGDNSLTGYGVMLIFNNSGVLRKSAGTVNTTIGGNVTFNNTGGTVDAQAGTIFFSAATGTVEDGSHFTGAGRTLVQGGSWTLNGSIHSENLEINTDVSGDHTFHGTVTALGGNFYGGTTTVASGATLTLSSGNKTLRSRTLTNHGSILWTGPTIECYDGAVINNLPGATLEAQIPTPGAYLSSKSGALSTLNNQGTIRITGAGIFYTSVTFNNSGTVDIQNGSLRVDQPAYNQTDGITQLNGGNLSLGKTAVFQGGTLRGSGRIDGSIQNAGAAVSPGLSPGSVTLDHDYSQEAGAIFNVEIAGSTAGTGFDQLEVGGKATLVGALQLTTPASFSPSPGDRFAILTYGSHTGAFTTVSGIDLPGGSYYALEYGSKELDLVVKSKPVIASLSRNSAQTGDAAFELTLTGSHFDAGSRVRWDETDLVTTYVSETSLTASVPASLLAGPGVAALRVVTPAPGEVASIAEPFFITTTGVEVLDHDIGSGTDPVATTGADGVTASASGAGTLSVAEYAANPGGNAAFHSTGAFVDVHVASGSTFSSLTIVNCRLNGGKQLYWWDGDSWELASDQVYSETTGCVTVTVSAATSPSLVDLAGTPFGAALVEYTISIPIVVR